MYWPPESGNIDPNSAKAKQAKREITAPSTQTSRNKTGLGKGPAISLAVRKMEEPMMPLTSSRTESNNVKPRIRLGFSPAWVGCVSIEVSMTYPIPSSSGDSNGLPQRRQITAEQSPQVSGSVTSSAQ